MFDEYKKKVLIFYHEKKAASSLSMNLTYPTRAKLRDECINVIRSRYLKKDKNTIEASFGNMDDMTAYVMRIKKSGAEKLKTLDNFLKDNLIGTDIKNIELLAWLIDFEPRPYHVEQQYGLPLNDEQKKSAELLEAKPAEEQNTARVPIPNSSNPTGQKQYEPVIDNVRLQKPRLFMRNLILSSIVIGAICLTTGAFFYLKGTPKKKYPAITGSEKCMVWAGDHYRPVSCTSTFSDRPVVALDTIQVKGFVKIMRNDTVTKNSINKLWYFKSGGQLELFTLPGFHPVHTDRKLRRLSEHMLYTYIHHD